MKYPIVTAIIYKLCLSSSHLVPSSPASSRKIRFDFVRLSIFFEFFTLADRIFLFYKYIDDLMTLYLYNTYLSKGAIMKKQRMRMVSFFMAPNDAQILKAIASDKGLTYSQILRDLVRSEIAKSA